MNPRIIVIDGKTYNSVDEMPPDIRQKYEAAMGSLGDANNNRIPDAFENINILADKDKNGVPDIVENLVAGQAVVNSMKMIVDGKEFNSLEGLPPEARAKYEVAMSQLDANRNGIPDFLEGVMNTTHQPVPSPTGFSVAQPANQTVTPDTSNGLMLVLAGLILFLLCAVGAGAVWYFFLR